MLDGRKTTRGAKEGVLNRTPFAPYLAALAAIEAAFLFALVAALSWQESVVAVLATTALAAGTVFTVREMQRLEKGQ